MPANLSPETPYWGPKNLDLPASGGLLVVRHAERHPIRSAAEAYVADLTSHGHAMAYDFGVRLGRRWRVGEVVASPTARCVETGQEILRGAGNGQAQPPVVRSLPILHFDQQLSGVPGLAGVYLDDPGFTTLVSSPGGPEYKLLKETLLALLPFPTTPGVINLAITHDVVVTFLKASLLGLAGATPDDFPGYLEGVCLVNEDGAARLR